MARPQNPYYQALARFEANRAAVVAAAVLAILLLAAIFAPLITKTGPNEQAFLAQSLALPSGEFWFGVDDLGRDFFTRIIYGARISLGIGLSAALFALLIGVPLGAAAGYFGGKIDWVVMRLIELFSVVPPLLAAMLLGALIGGGLWTIILISGLFGWVQICLLVRAQVLAFKDKDFIRAARALGAPTSYLLRRHLLPNAISPVIIGFVLAIPQAMMLEAALSFLGIGLAPPTPSWGQMINSGTSFMYFYWHLAVFPTLALAVSVLAISIFGDGLRDAFDPTLKGA